MLHSQLLSMAEVTLVAEMAENFPPLPPFRHTAIVDWVVNSPEYLAVFLDDDGIGVCITFCWPCNGNIVGTRSNDYISGSTILRVYTLDISKIQKGTAIGQSLLT